MITLVSHRMTSPSVAELTGPVPWTKSVIQQAQSAAAGSASSHRVEAVQMSHGFQASALDIVYPISVCCLEVDQLCFLIHQSPRYPRCIFLALADVFPKTPKIMDSHSTSVLTRTLQLIVATNKTAVAQMGETSNCLQCPEFPLSWIPRRAPLSCLQ